RNPLHFADAALPPPPSGSFTATPAAASLLFLTPHPAGATPSSPTPRSSDLTVQDAYGNTVTSDTSTVTATINTGTGTLQGTTSSAADPTAATHTHHHIDSSGLKTIHFADSALTTANSGSFTVSPAAAGQLVI